MKEVDEPTVRLREELDDIDRKISLSLAAYNDTKNMIFMAATNRLLKERKYIVSELRCLKTIPLSLKKQKKLEQLLHLHPFTEEG